jgi:hypothetical protein
MAAPFSTRFRNFTSILRAGGFVFRSRRTLGIRVINKSGSSIAANKLVAISGYDTTSKLPKIVLADADAANLATDVYVTTAAIANNAQQDVYKGFMSSADLNTNSATTVGDPVYLSATAGAFTHTAPTGSNARVQIVGYVQVKSATVGQIAWDIQPPSQLGVNDINGVGFATGQGGAVTQLTSKATGVTLNAKTGQITTHNAALAAAAEVAFTVTNSFVAATDVVVASIASGGTSASYSLSITAVAAGSFELTIGNWSAGSLGEALVINFAVIKGVAS